MKKIFSFLLILISFYLRETYAQADLLFSPKGIAKIEIVLEDNKHSSDIEKDVKIPASVNIVNANGSTYENSELFNGRVKIEGRGNSTWELDKKPYNIDLMDANGAEVKAGLLGMPKDSEWALLANYSDKSNIRVPLAYYLGAAFGMEYSPRTRYVELYLNGSYDGLYVLCEKVNRGTNRVPIAKMETDLSGGYIIEVTPANRLDKENDSIFYVDNGQRYFTLKYPKAKNLTQEQMDWISDYTKEFDAVLYSNNFKDHENGFRKYIDENTIIDWYIINELAKNVDSRMYASVYFYKDAGGKFKMGPLWDFDIAFGNHEDVRFQQENRFWTNTVSWMERFFEDEAFAAKVRLRYNEIMPILDRIPSVIQANMEQLVSSGAIERNFERWDILGKYVWPNPEPYPTTYEGEVRYLTDWVTARETWLDVNLGASEEDRCERFRNTKPQIRPLSPDQFWTGNPSTIRAIRGYSKYIWNDTLTTKSYEIEIAKGGEYRVKMVDENECVSLVSEPLVFIAKGMVEFAGNGQYVCGSDPKKLIRTTPKGLNTQSFITLDDEIIIDLQNLRTAGTYKITTVIDEPYYKGEEISYTVTTTIATGISFYDKTEHQIYPNPASDYINISFGKAGRYCIRIVDAFGKILFNKTIDDTLIRIDVRNFPQGFYVLLLENINNKESTKQKVFIYR